jgi:hypothetical protein
MDTNIDELKKALRAKIYSQKLLRNTNQAKQLQIKKLEKKINNEVGDKIDLEKITESYKK